MELLRIQLLCGTSSWSESALVITLKIFCELTRLENNTQRTRRIAGDTLEYNGIGGRSDRPMQHAIRRYPKIKVFQCSLKLLKLYLGRFAHPCINHLSESDIKNIYTTFEGRVRCLCSICMYVCVLPSLRARVCEKKEILN